jgi:hypothetical protein
VRLAGNGSRRLDRGVLEQRPGHAPPSFGEVRGLDS